MTLDLHDTPASSFAIMRRIFASGLPRRLKLLALALALHGDSRGANIYPSVRTLANWLGRKRRSVQMALRKLESDGLLQRVNPGLGLAGKPNPAGKYTTVYRLCLDRLPAAVPRTTQGRKLLRPYPTDQGRKLATHKGANSWTTRAHGNAPDLLRIDSRSTPHKKRFRSRFEGLSRKG